MDEKGCRRILLVDDAEDITTVLSGLLQIYGYEVVVAADGVQALEQLRSGAPLPQLVLLDLMMPRMNGWEFREEQQKDPVLSKIPVVILSGGGKVAEHARALGVNDYLAKPVDVDTLLTYITKFCGGGSASKKPTES